MKTLRLGTCATRSVLGSGGSYLRLDAVQTSEPEDLASSQLHLGVVDLVGVLRQLLLVDLLLGDAVARLLQELEVVRGDGGHQLRVWKEKIGVGGLGWSITDHRRYGTQLYHLANQAAIQDHRKQMIVVLFYSKTKLVLVRLK